MCNLACKKISTEPKQNQEADSGLCICSPAYQKAQQDATYHKLPNCALLLRSLENADHATILEAIVIVVLKINEALIRTLQN